MGCCGSDNTHTMEQIKVDESAKSGEKINQIESLKKAKETKIMIVAQTAEVSIKSKILNFKELDKTIKMQPKIEKFEILPYEKFNRYFLNVSRSICKLAINSQEKEGLEKPIGTGFFLCFYIDQELFYCLMTNEHVITKDKINSNNTIYISYDIEFKEVNIKLDEKERYINTFTKIHLDITVFEILDKDKISKDYFLFNEDGIDNNTLINSEIYIPQFPKGEELVNARGIIKEIDEYEFTHLANTEHDSSGSPIFLENSVYVLGIHIGSDKFKNNKYGYFIYPALDIIKRDIRNKRNNGK